MFGRWLKPASKAPASEGGERLREMVRRELPDADEETVLVVVAITGLLGAVAYADRSYSDREEQRVRAELERVHGMTPSGIEAICALLRSHAVEAATVEAPRYARTLLELGDRELRVEVLGALLEIAAADGEITTAETNVLRHLTKALGLTQDDYNGAQQKHRERLGVLGSTR